MVVCVDDVQQAHTHTRSDLVPESRFIKDLFIFAVSKGEGGFVRRFLTLASLIPLPMLEEP